MAEAIAYGIGFFILTVGLQFLLFKKRKNHNHDQNAIWTGNRAVIILSVIGIMEQNMNYLPAILGFTFADEIGRTMGWHL